MKPELPDDEASRPVIAISSCLLGEAVRYDGGDRRVSWVTGPLADHVDYQAICPEVAIGLGVPRPPIQLIGDPAAPRAVGVTDPTRDVTDALAGFARRTARHLGGVSGYLFKSRSPSCGMRGVRLHGQQGGRKKTAGVHARIIMAHLPNLPVAEEGHLGDPVLRENFINRVYVYRRWQAFRRRRLTAKGLIDFHVRHKYMVMAHSQAAYKRLGKLLSDLKGVALPTVADVYIAELMVALRRPVSRGRHANVLQHLMGYLKASLGSADKQALAEAIEAYRCGEVPLILPMFLLRQHFRRHPDPYIAAQWYLDPYPGVLGLRNNI